MAQVIEIGDFQDAPVISLNKIGLDGSSAGSDNISINESSGVQPSVNFGSGIELLMNDKNKKSGGKKAGVLMGVSMTMRNLWNRAT